MANRLLFLCARGSARSLLAASILAAQPENHWEVWSSPAQDQHGVALAVRVLGEKGTALLPAERQIQPLAGMRWDEGIILCSGQSAT